MMDWNKFWRAAFSIIMPDRRHSTPGLFLLLTLAVLLSACSSAPDLETPPDIRYGEDTCDRCLMIINEAAYAAAYVTEDGETLRFDDIGGMLAHHDETAAEVAVFWVHDLDTEAWLKAEEAFFVKSDEYHTPMGFGIIAFSDRSRAEAWATEQSGMVFTFAELMAQDGDMDHDHTDG